MSMQDAETKPVPRGYHLNHALLRAGRDGRWLAQETEANYVTVSRWRSGTKPSKAMQEKVIEAFAKDGFTYTAEELGW